MSTGRRGRAAAGVGLMVTVAVLGASCGSDDKGPSTASTGTLSNSAPPPATAEPAGYAPQVDPASFTAVVDNPLYPLPVGARWVYESRSEEGTERIEIEVLPETQTVMGVDCVVVRDTVTLDGQVIEDTYDWYAQDAEGNVWYFGEDTTEFEDGVPVNHNGAWTGGVDGAQPGILMKAHPAAGDSYKQEFYPGEAEDEAEVLRVGEHVEIPFGTFDGVVVTRDFTTLDPGVEENKFYAPGVGLVKILKLDTGVEELLVEFSR